MWDWYTYFVWCVGTLESDVVSISSLLLLIFSTCNRSWIVIILQVTEMYASCRDRNKAMEVKWRRHFMLKHLLTQHNRQFNVHYILILTALVAFQCPAYVVQISTICMGNIQSCDAVRNVKGKTADISFLVTNLKVKNVILRHSVEKKKQHQSILEHLQNSEETYLKEEIKVKIFILGMLIGNCS